MQLKRSEILILIVASLGYFVDIYDLILFNFVKKQSLMDLGVLENAVKEIEMSLMNWQMFGMLLGGIVWGVLGDKFGRLKVLFGSIIIYSLANIANAHVQDLTQYSIIRFIAGFGLAGELGAGITLISEVMSKEKRGYGTMIIVTFGALGAVAGYFISSLFSWQTCYYIGGGMGLALLALRVGTLESNLFTKAKEKPSNQGNFFFLFQNKERAKRFLYCILMGLPVWFVVGILISYSESWFVKGIGLPADIRVADATLYCYIGLSLGDLGSGILSQYWKSRKKVIFTYLIACAVMSLTYLFVAPHGSVGFFYFVCLMLGTATGYWALFASVSAEQFGTNMRATVATSVPNFVRGALIPLSFLFKGLEPNLGVLGSAAFVGLLAIGSAYWATYKLKETFARDLDFMEE
jgi:MFS transporter, putative metabolite:H+ symporter